MNQDIIFYSRDVKLKLSTESRRMPLQSEHYIAAGGNRQMMAYISPLYKREGYKLGRMEWILFYEVCVFSEKYMLKYC